jgi:adenylate cyclase
MSSAGEANRPPKIDVSDVAAWLVDGARSASMSQDVLQELCIRLVDRGISLWRVAVYVQTLHPLIMTRRFVWKPGATVEIGEASFALAGQANYRSSPVLRIQSSGETIRRRLADPACPIDYPILSELKEEGVTDYLGMPLCFTNAEIHCATFTTRQPGGFTPNEIAGLESIITPLARVAEVRALRRTAVNLLNSYVGRDAGERILSGRIQRGDTETIRAAIWLSDMRGFTRRADTMAPEALIELLNHFYDQLVPPIEAEGGEVLKFMGDGLLAIFRIGEGDADTACARALGAARQAIANVAVKSAESVAAGGADLRFGLALHVGEALYGNIGAGARLDFTCIGPAINLAARLEKIASRLGRIVVASAAFAGRLPEEFAQLGDFELAGFRQAETVFGLKEEST